MVLMAGRAGRWSTSPATEAVMGALRSEEAGAGLGGQRHRARGRRHAGGRRRRLGDEHRLRAVGRRCAHRRRRARTGRRGCRGLGLRRPRGRRSAAARRRPGRAAGLPRRGLRRELGGRGGARPRGRSWCWPSCPPSTGTPSPCRSWPPPEGSHLVDGYRGPRYAPPTVSVDSGPFGRWSAHHPPDPQEDPVSELRALRNIVGGEPVDTVEGRTLDLVDPSTGEVFAHRAGLRRPRTSTGPTRAARGLRDLARHHARRSGSGRCCSFADAGRGARRRAGRRWRARTPASRSG